MENSRAGGVRSIRADVRPLGRVQRVARLQDVYLARTTGELDDGHTILQLQ